MAEEVTKRMSQVAKQLNVGTPTIVQHLAAKGLKVDNNPNTKLTREHLEVLSKDFGVRFLLETEPPKKEEVVIVPDKTKAIAEEVGILYFRDSPKANAPTENKIEQKSVESEVIKPEVKLTGPKIVGKIDLNAANPVIVPIEPALPVTSVVEQSLVKVVEPKVSEQLKEPVVEKPITKPSATQPVVEEKPAPVEATKPDISIPTPPVEEKTSVVEQPKADVPTKEKILVIEPPVIESKPQPVTAPTPPEMAKPSDNQQKVNNNLAHQKQGDKSGKKDNQPRHQQHQKPKQDSNQQKTNQHSIANNNGQLGHNNNQAQQQQKKDKERERKEAAVAAQLNPEKVELIEAKAERLQGLTVLGKISLPVDAPKEKDKDRKKKKRKRIRVNEQVNTDGKPPRQQGGGNHNNQQHGGSPKKEGTANNTPSTNTNNNSNTRNNSGGGANNANNNNRKNNTNTNNNNRSGGQGQSPRKDKREEVSQKEVQDKLKATLSTLGTSKKANFGADKRRERRKIRAEQQELRQLQEDEEAKVLKVTEFISVSDLASMMDVSSTEVISTCMSMGMFVSINQRLDAEAIALISDEFGFAVHFVSAEEEIEVGLEEVADAPEDLVERAPIVTIMGHVDHGKTSLLDYIRKAKVAAGEAGGITQHIGAYSVKTDQGKRIAFLDTPGHEAFTAMRARGAKVTDIVIIVIAADDAVMPQTEEAINHAQNAGVPIVFAFSKVDKPGANPEKIREQLAQRNLLVEEWGGKYQTQEINSKTGAGINDLLEKVLLESELLELKANAKKKAVGAIIEASLDKGRGYVATVLVQAGTLRVGDVLLAGAHYGKVKAMFDHLGKKVKEAGPSTPVQVLGLNGAPQAGDKLNVMDAERDAREIATKREQILREQSMRTRKHITLEEIGRRKAIGTFKELNVIIKGDVDGSVEALTDSLLKLSTDEVQVRVIHKAVGQVSESDVLLASAADAVIVAFQVRPSTNAKRLADQEQIEIRTYSIIYQAIDDVKLAMEGLLEPTTEEVVTANIEVRDVFKISKIGTVAGCYVLDGGAKRSHKIRVVRDFIVVHDGEINALKRFKDDVNEVKAGYECGLSIKNFHDIQVGDILECYELKEVKRSL
jgi:translation initiation factor IF-2